MGGEIGQHSEWSITEGINWWLLENELNQGMQNLVSDLNGLYRTTPALYEKQFQHVGFEWCEINDYENSVLSFIRYGNDRSKPVLIICNMTPVVRENYRVGVSTKGKWSELLNSDDLKYGGSGILNDSQLTLDEGMHGKRYSIGLKLPPLGAVFLGVET